MSTPIILVPPLPDPDPVASAEWVHAFYAHLAKLGTVPVTADGALTAATVVTGQPAPQFSDGIETKLAQLTKRGKGKANADLIRTVLDDLVAVGLALTPAPNTATGKLGQPYVRVHRPANGKPDTAGYLHASYFAFTGALAHVPPAEQAKLTIGESMTWIDLDAPGAAGIIVNACTAFLQNP